MDNLTELTAKIGFNIDNKKLDTLKNNLLSIKNTLYLTFGTVAIKSLFNQFTSIFDTLDRVRAGLFLGRQANPVWYLLGIDPTQDPNKVFDELLKKIRLIKDEGVRRSRVAELGFNPDLIESLIHTDTQGNTIKEIVKDLRTVKQTIFEILIRITTGITPILKIITTFLHNWRVILDNIFLSMGGWQEGLTKLLRIFILIYVWNNKIKSLLIGTALAIEDLWIFSKGGKSYFEEVLKYFNITQERIEFLRKLVGGIFKGIPEGFKTFIEICLNSIKILITTIENAIQKLLIPFETTIKILITTIENAIQKLLIPFKTIQFILTAIMEGATEFVKFLVEVVMFYVDIINKTIQKIIHPFKNLKGIFEETEEEKRNNDKILNELNKEFINNINNNYFNKTTNNDYINNINNKNYSLNTIKDIERTTTQPSTNNKYINQNDNRNITNNININESQKPKETAQEIFNLQEELTQTKWELQ